MDYSFHPTYTHAERPLREGEFVYVRSTNAIGKVLAVFNRRGVQDVRTDVDGMRDGDDLERLEQRHFANVDLFITADTLEELPLELRPKKD